MQINTTVMCPVYDSFRVRQVAGMFDVPLAEKAASNFAVEIPALDELWEIGLIVGPSGSGKSTIAKAAFGDSVVTHFDWPTDQAVIDCFGDLTIKQITGLLVSVGFSSPPSWIKPYAVLSGGEKFRCDLARALGNALHGLQTSAPVVFDEFTSVVDRNVARIGSAAVAKAIRRINRSELRVPSSALRFIAVSCHYDIAEWLEPDWVVDMAGGTCTRRRLRRPPIALRLHRSSTAAWPLFARHHYLSGKLNPSACCYLAWWQGEPVAFVATLPVWSKQNHRRVSRVVVLPDYQGIGIGMRVTEAVGELHLSEGKRFSLTASHPATIAHCVRSSLWATRTVARRGTKQTRGRAVVSFEYLGATT